MINCSIVTYNTSRSDLQSVINCIANSCVESIYIIDNSINDSIKEYTKSLSSKVKYFHGHGNIGFGRAHNIAIQKSIDQGAEYHIVINPDIFFDKGVIEYLANFMEVNPDVGLIMPKILNKDGSIQYLPKLLPTPISIIKRKLPITGKVKNRMLNNYELRFLEESTVIEVPVISGCFSFFRTIVFKTIGFYDDRFFLYFEDFDISRRVSKHFKTVLNSNIAVYHGYESGANKNIRLLKVFLTSLIKYFNKWGWFFDKERTVINRNTVVKIKKRYNILL